MKVHIVCSRLETGRIIPRLARQLAQDAHFTISEKPDDKADINYFLIYLEYPKNGYTKTKTAALFSHKEENEPSKAKEWERVAKAVDVRLTWTQKYLKDLEQYGESYIVIPPIDRVKFNVRFE